MARAAVGAMVKFGAGVTVASAPAVCQDAATSPLVTASRTMPAKAATVSARTRANAGSAGVSAVRDARARPRNAGARLVRARGPQQSAQHQRVQPEHHDHGRDGDQQRRGAGVEVHARSGLLALVAEHDDARHRGGHQHHLDDQPAPGRRWRRSVSRPGQAMLPGGDERGTADGDDQHGDRRPPAAGRAGGLHRAGPGDGQDREHGPDHGRRDADERGSRPRCRGRSAAATRRAP